MPDHQSRSAARVCADCGYVFPAPEVQLEATATTRPILSTGRPEWVDVGAVTYHRHEKPGKPPSLRVDYHCGLVRHREWVCLEHDGYAGQKAVALVAPRGPRATLAPATVDEALARTDELRRPAQIAVRPNGRLHGGRPCEVRMTAPGLCAVCRRGTRGFGWFDARFAVGDPRRDREPPLALLARSARTSAIGGAA